MVRDGNNLVGHLFRSQHQEKYLMADEQQQNKTKSRMMILGFFLLFFSPVLLSWYLVFYTDYKPGSGVQHGILIDPPRQLDNLQLLDPVSGKTHSLYGNWNMLVLEDQDCDESCINDLYRMRQIRLATGNDVTRVQRVIYFSSHVTTENAGELFKNYIGQLMLPAENINEQQLSLFEVTGIAREHTIYLIDSAGFLMMGYPDATDPVGIIKDLKRLLRLSRSD